MCRVSARAITTGSICKHHGSLDPNSKWKASLFFKISSGVLKKSVVVWFRIVLEYKHQVQIFFVGIRRIVDHL
jgi:hypothetical protein